MCITICGIDPGLMNETGHTKPVHWDNPEGWDVEGGGRGVQDGGHIYILGYSCQCMAKIVTIL